MADNYVYPFSMVTAPNERFMVIPFNFSLIANQTKTVLYTLSAGSNFVMDIVNSFSTSTFSFNIKDVYKSEDLFISATRGSIATGNGQNPFIIPRSHRFLGNCTIEIEVTDLSGAPNTVQIGLIGHKEYLGAERTDGMSGRLGRLGAGTVENIASNGVNEKYLIDRLFCVPFNFTQAGAGLTYSSKYALSTGFDFMWECLNVYYTREFTLGIKDEFVTEDFFSDNLYISTIAGNGQKPFILPRPYIFRGGSYINVTINDLSSGGVSDTVQLVFIGYKVKRVG
jgi:hypothetical protein